METPVDVTEYEKVWSSTGGRYNGFDRYMARAACVNKYGFAIPTMEALNALLQLGPIIEVGAGSGYWAYELRKLGADIVASDLETDESTKRWKTKWTEMEKISAVEAVAKYRDRSLFMCWPSYEEDWSGLALAEYRGDRFALVAEDRLGCVGGRTLWDEIDANWEETRHIHIPQWDGIHDGLSIYRRKG